MTILFANDASTTISGAITNTATAVSLATGSGSLFPNPTGGDYYVATFIDEATGLLKEIVHVTAMSGDVATIVRGQEGTTALNWAAGDFFANQITAGTAAAFLQSAVGGVTSFNGRSGAVTLLSSDVTSALGYTPANSSSLVPPGAIFDFGSASGPPVGYLECNGSLISTTTYSDLFGVLGYTFGGSGVSFALPDLRGYFTRGWSHGSSVDSGRVFGSTQLDQFQGHRHTWGLNSTYPPGSPTGVTPPNLWSDNAGAHYDIYLLDGSAGAVGVNLTNTSTPVADLTDGSPRYGTETRPVNVALMKCIKY
jgi:microcystin-dependent protein